MVSFGHGLLCGHVGVVSVLFHCTLKINHPHPRPALLDSHRGVWGAWSAKTRHDTPGIKEAFAPRRFHLCDLSVVAGSLFLLCFFLLGLYFVCILLFSFSVVFPPYFLFVFAPTHRGSHVFLLFFLPFGVSVSYYHRVLFLRRDYLVHRPPKKGALFIYCCHDDGRVYYNFLYFSDIHPGLVAASVW